jgi:hypothetical protein
MSLKINDQQGNQNIMRTPVINIVKEHFKPTELVNRKGCPCQLTSCCQISHFSKSREKCENVMQEFATMRLVHRTKTTHIIKNSLSLNRIHHELEVDSLHLSKSGSSNILLSKVSFDCLIITKSEKKYRDYLSFDLRIPGANTEEETVFSYDMIEKAYNGKVNLYETLKHFYTFGRSIANNEDHKHGHRPDYDSKSSKHDQYIRHTEQLLVAYLALPEAAKMLSNRLRLELRGKYADVNVVKVYNMGLHMHSTKTCCAPCEYSLIGLMNDNKGLNPSLSPKALKTTFF